MPGTGKENSRPSMTRKASGSSNSVSSFRRTSMARPVAIRPTASSSTGSSPSSSQRRTSMASNKPVNICESPVLPGVHRRNSNIPSGSGSRRSSLANQKRAEDPENLLATKERSSDGRSTPTPGARVSFSFNDITNTKKNRKSISRRSLTPAYEVGLEPNTTECMHCPEKFATAELKYAHYKVEHSFHQVYKCNRMQCGNRFDKRAQLNVHKARFCEFPNAPVVLSDSESDSGSDSE